MRTYLYWGATAGVLSTVTLTLVLVSAADGQAMRYDVLALLCVASVVCAGGAGLTWLTARMDRALDDLHRQSQLGQPVAHTGRDREDTADLLRRVK